MSSMIRRKRFEIKKSKLKKTLSGTTSESTLEVWRDRDDTGSKETLQSREQEFLPQPDLRLREDILVAIKEPTFENCELLKLRDDDAEKAMSEMQSLFDDRSFWQAVPTEHRNADRWMIIPLMAKLSRESEIIPKSVYVQPEEVEFQYIGSGGFATIHRAKLQGRAVVVKRLQKQRFCGNAEEKQMDMLLDISREALLWCNLSHPNIVPFLGVEAGTSHSDLGMVLLWMDKGDINTFLFKSKKSNPHEILVDKINWLQQVANGMVYLHIMGPRIVHGDIRGSNIFLNSQGVVKIGDFGLSVFEGEWSGEFGSERAGNPRWLAPELLLPKRGLVGRLTRPTFASDVYSFAMTCIEFFSKELKPFDHIEANHNVAQAVGNHGERPHKPDSMPAELFEQLDHWWNSLPEERPSIQHVFDYLKIYEVTGKFPNQAWASGTVNKTRVSPVSSHSVTSPDKKLLDILSRWFPKDQTYLSPLSHGNDQPIGYSENPNFILVDEISLLDGLYKNYGTKNLNFSSFPFHSLHLILTRGRVVAGRFLFADTSNPVFTYNFRNLGYSVIKVVDNIIRDTDVVSQKICDIGSHSGPSVYHATT
ncbi:hypothetical protein QCA50_011407 [Cerrena zonata]|uniref:Protein kinase domain-containing protein n=1 Tax=Cerrena zonata TaxID=2478898 RepID=A0AAW0G957_9APHY